MNKKTVAEFFDKCADWWDSDMIRHEDIIQAILDNGGITEGVDVLDVACGTGVLFPDYLSRKVASVTAIDISPEMAKIAAAKYPQVQVLCGDVEETDFGRQFDAIMVYNAFPHFPDPERLIAVLAGLCKPGGRLSIAHGMSRAALADHHAGRAAQVSIDLISETELARLMEPWFTVDVVISDDRMYQVSGIRREGAAPIVKPQTDMDELLALMKFMVSHNDAHAQELAGLAEKLKDSGKTRAYKHLMDAVAAFDVANAQLSGVLKELSDDM